MTQQDPLIPAWRDAISEEPASGMWLVVLNQDGEESPGLMLGDSRLSLGAGNEDDVYLTGVGVVPAHLRMVFLEGRMTLLAAAEAVRIDGEPVLAFPADIAPLQVISLGPDTHLAYGHRGSTWPSAPAWESPQEVVDPIEESLLDPSEHPDEAHERARPPMTKRARVVHGARWASLALAAATVVVVGAVLTDLAWGVRETVVPGEVAIERSEDLLKKWLESEPASYQSVSLTVRDDGALSLTGFIDSEETYKKLAQQVRQQSVSSGGNVRMDVLTATRLESMVRDILARFPLIGRLDISPERVLIVVSGVRLEQDVMDRIETDLSRLGTRTQPLPLGVEFRVQDSYRLMQQITKALSQSPTTRDLRFEIDESGGRIVGQVPAAIEIEALAAAHAVKSAFESQLPITIALKVDAKLNFHLVSLSQGGDAPSATLVQRGKVQTYRLGEMVFGVGELTDVRVDGVTLALGRREVFMPLSR